MGTYDSFFVRDDLSAERLRCAEGHLLKDREFQSKSLHCNLDHYYVVDAMLYRLRGNGTWKDPAPKKSFAIVDWHRDTPYGRLAITTRETAEFEPLTREVDLYTSCHECDPVCFEIGDSALNFNGRLNHREPRVQYFVNFEAGRLVQAHPVGCETRQMVRERLLKEGLHVLPDDDRVVKRHVAVLREHDHKYRR